MIDAYLTGGNDNNNDNNNDDNNNAQATRGGSIPETSRNTNRNKDLHEDELDADHSDAP